MRPRPTWNNRRGEGEKMKWLRDRANHKGEDCLTWPFSTIRGYGNLGHEGKHYYAHRVMCELVNGPPPSPQHLATHTCGKGHEGCVNPLHLKWGSRRDNLLDRRRHGTVRGNSYGNKGKLKPAEIEVIKSYKGRKTKQELADFFGVKYATIQYWHGIRDRKVRKIVSE